MKAYFEKDGLLTKCIIKEKNETFVGYAKCLEEDREFYSDFTGQEIAYEKALIKYLKYLLKNVRTEQKNLMKFYNSIKDCNKFEFETYAPKMLRERIRDLSISIQNLEDSIMNAKYYLIKYIKGKDDLHNKIREMRKEK